MDPYGHGNRLTFSKPLSIQMHHPNSYFKKVLRKKHVSLHPIRKLCRLTIQPTNKWTKGVIRKLHFQQSLNYDRPTD